MAATAFANLVEDRPIRWCGGPVWLLVLVLWGSLLGTAYRLLPTGLATLSTLGFGALYVLAAQAQFAMSGIWYPLVIPVGVHSVLAVSAVGPLRPLRLCGESSFHVVIRHAVRE